MRNWFAITSLLLSVMTAQGHATPPDPALQRELLDLYGRFNKLVVAGKLADAAQLRTAKARADMLAITKKPKREQAEMMEMARLMTPDEVTPVHANLAADGETATIEVLASKTWPAGVSRPGPSSWTSTRVISPLARRTA